VKQPKKLIASILLTLSISIVAASATTSSISSWYVGLNKPFFNPPNWLFGPVWTVLYIAIAIAWYLIWKQGWEKKEVKQAGYLYIFQLVLNFLWSFSFFAAQSPLLGLVNIVVLLVAIILTMKKFKPLSKAALYLFIPYLAWVSFATLLNGAILVLN
jgi:translocator protein